jgi:hypothetical protein
MFLYGLLELFQSIPVRLLALRYPSCLQLALKLALLREILCSYYTSFIYAAPDIPASSWAISGF